MFRAPPLIRHVPSRVVHARDLIRSLVGCDVGRATPVPPPLRYELKRFIDSNATLQKESRVHEWSLKRTKK